MGKKKTVTQNLTNGVSAQFQLHFCLLAAFWQDTAPGKFSIRLFNSLDIEEFLNYFHVNIGNSTFAKKETCCLLTKTYSCESS